jgi:hypothetical protein
MDDIIKGVVFFAALYFFSVSPHRLKVTLLFAAFAYIIYEAAQTGTTNRTLGLVILAGFATCITIWKKQDEDKEAAKANPPPTPDKTLR